MKKFSLVADPALHAAMFPSPLGEVDEKALIASATNLISTGFPSPLGEVDEKELEFYLTGIGLWQCFHPR